MFSEPGSTEDATVRAGLNVLAGTRVFVTKQVALFGEYKYNHTSFPGGDFTANYQAHFVVFGVGWHF
jgi:opacity protein-like surface antigen